MKIRGAVLERVGAPSPFASSRPITIGELTLDPPGPNELLVRIEVAGVCHSDLSVVDGNRVRPTPMLLGHEAAGIVEAMGPQAGGDAAAGGAAESNGVAGAGDAGNGRVGDSNGAGGAGHPEPITIGDRVVMTFLPRCGHCAGCATGGRLPCEVGTAANNAGTLLGGETRLHRGGAPVSHHLGVSAFATYAVVNRASVVRVEPDVPAEVAALLGCAVLTGGGAVVNSARPEPGDTIMVVGLGGVGMAAVLVALSLGHHVIGVDGVAQKLENARSCGVTETYTPEELVASGVRAPIVIEAAGNARAFETAVRATAPGGRTVTVGLPAPDARASISPLILTAEARTIIGSYLGSAVPSRDIPRFADLWRQGRLPVEKLISARVQLDDLNEAMDALAEGRALRQLIVFPV
ncbi:zinc-binding dehydrogenase [Subtercola sp. RTI3]|uniref:zinc-binding dehydrogenase n=1 Tax=Subtercola sp. RTI3 TaxID=3048639 RepID=UPI002B239E56|nr:zinc-binding dehydrogenase [Subtercola sp. RTI3]MEA9986352.1 alcohol dehydrogenase catalytic domain-containing protein [Subtercola sp. RTI3]